MALAAPHIRVSLSAAVPYIQYDAGKKKWTGLFVSLLEAVCDFLEFSCTYAAAPAVPVVSKNETLEGVMGSLFNETADIGLTAIGISYSRSKIFGFVDSFLSRTYMVVIHEDYLLPARTRDFMFQALMQIVTTGVWTGLFAILLIFVAVGVASDLCKRRTKCQKISLLQLIVAWLFQTLGTGFGLHGYEDFQPTQLKLMSASKAILLASWFLYTFLILCTILSQLPVIFTLIASQKPPFSDVKGLLDSNFTIYGTATAIDMLNVSKARYHEALAKKAILLPSTPVINKAIDRYEYYVQLAQSQPSAFIVNQETLQQMALYNCKVVVAVDNLVHVRIAALVFTKDFALRETFHRGYALAHQNGVLSAGAKDYQLMMKIAFAEKNRICDRRTFDERPKLAVSRNVIRLESFTFLFWVGGLGFAGSLAIFIGELTLSYYRKSRRNNFSQSFSRSFICRKTKNVQTFAA